MQKFNFDIIQAQINIIKLNFFTKAENEGYNLIQFTRSKIDWTAQLFLIS